jgi:hypothetical protein
MNVTQNVVKDLLPVYLSGEASSDTQELVEEFMRRDPEIAIAVESQKREFESQRDLLEAAGGPSADHELRTLTQTRSLMERQKWSMAIALMLTGFPLSFVFGDGHLIFMIARDEPLLAAASWLGAAVVWIQYAASRRRLRKAGL